MSAGSRDRGRWLAGSVAAILTLALLAVPAPSPAADYVAMGDSYSSGTGTRDYYEPNCERSNLSYSKLIDPQVPGDLKLIACGGARTTNITGGGQHGNPGQGSDPGLGAGTDRVTISIGGNDAGFSDVLLECGQPSWASDCDRAVDDAQDYISGTLPGRLDAAYDRIRARAPNAAVTVVGYPRIFNGEDCAAATFFSEGEMIRLNQTADMLADVTRTRTQAHGFGFADARGAFLRHAWCDDVEWINGLSNPVNESYHPNKAGHSDGYAGIVRAALLAQASPNAVRGANGRIAFTRGPSGGEDVWTINGDGGFPVRLASNSSASDVDPTYSPDGSRLAFASNRGGDYEIYVADADGTGLTQLTFNGSDDLEPAWSPNGEYIAFRAARDGNNEIYTMTASGGAQKRLTNNPASDFAPAWSPDGAEIAWQRFSGSNNDIYKMSSDGQGQTRLTTDAANDGAPSWSPDGTRIAFHSNRGGDFEIFTMTGAGGSQTPRTVNSIDDRDPSYSPDGASIAFERGGEIFTMSASGGSQTQRTTDPAFDSEATWQADAEPPETTIGPTPATFNTATPSFGLGSNEPGSTFECRIDEGAFAPCASPYRTEPLAEGRHELRVRATDPSGNVDPSPALRVFRIDTTPAGTAITGGPTGPTNDPTPTFEFIAADPGVSFECAVDDAELSACESPFTTGTLADGGHTFRVVGTDDSGVNTDEAVAEFIVDTVAPEPRITFGPAAATNESQPSIEFSSSEEGGSFECRLDDGDWISGCSSPFVPGEPLADGPHSFEVRTTDAAGNDSTVVALTSFTVDTVAPDVAIDSGPPDSTQAPNPTSDSTPEFTFSSTDAPAPMFECRVDSLDDATWAGCSSPYVTEELGDGGHFFQVRSIDAAGNASEAAERRFIVDVTAPETVITGVDEPPNPTNRPVLSFESDDPDATFECRVDPREGDGWVPCEPGAELRDPRTGEALDDGHHRLEVRAVDQVDNEDLSPASREFLLDTVDPETELTGTPGRFTNDPRPPFEFESGAEDPETASAVRFECRFDAGPWTSCTSPFEPGADLADGPHEFEVGAIDAAGNLDETPASYEFEVDTVAPSVAISGAALTNDPTPSFDLDPNEAEVELRCSVGPSQRGVACSPPLFTASPLSEGQYTLDVAATDRAGNTAELAGSFDFVLDTTAPATNLTGGPSGTTTDPTPTFEFDAGTEAEPRFECRIDGGVYRDCASPHTTEPLADGAHRFEVRAVDPARNADASPAARTFTIDTRPTRPGPPPPEAPSSQFGFGDLERNKRKGTARLEVRVPGTGALTLRGAGLKRTGRTAPGAGVVELAVVPKGRIAKRLRKRGSVRVEAEVRFRPDGGARSSRRKQLKLVQRDRSKG